MIRRKFIKKTSSLIALTAFGKPVKSMAPLQSKGQQNYSIIDTHQHLWDIEQFQLKWPVPPIDGQNFLMPEYDKATKGLNIIKSIYMEVDVPQHLRREEALFALDICRNPNNRTVKAVICADPSDSDFRSFMADFVGNEHIMGIRCRFTSVEAMLSSTSISNLQWLAGQGMSFDLGIGPSWLGEAEKLVKACPETIFILNHCGNADPVAFFPDTVRKPRPPKCDAALWQADISKLGSYPNVYCKISGIVAHVRDYKLSAELLKVPINHCLEAFAADKVLFASDWPVCRYNMSLKNWVNTLKQIVRSRPIVEQKKLFHDNAVKLYNL